MLGIKFGNGGIFKAFAQSGQPGEPQLTKIAAQVIQVHREFGEVLDVARLKVG